MNIEEIVSTIYSFIESENPQDAFAFYKKIQSMPTLPKTKEFLQAYTLLQIFTLPLQSDQEVQSLLENSVLRLLQSNLSLKKYLQDRVFPYPESSQPLVLLSLFGHFVQNKEAIGRAPLSEWMELYLQTVGTGGKTTANDKVRFIQKYAREYDVNQNNKQLLFGALDIFDFLRPNINFDQIENVESEPGTPYRAPSYTDQNISQYTNKEKEEIDQAQTSPYTTSRQEVSMNAASENLVFKKAIQKYPRIMNQPITGAKILLRGSREAISGTLKNWITSYQQDMGPAPHEPFERNQFLFHNRNALVLSPGERNILSEILRSFDEGLPLPIDSVQQQIVLDRMQGGADLSEQVLENQGGKIKEGTLSLVEFEDSSKKSERPSFSKEGSSQYESIQKEVQNVESLQNASSKKEVSHAKQMASDAEMGHKEGPGKIQGQRMRGDVGVQRPQKTLGDASKKADSFINKLTKGQKQIEGLQHELQGGSVRHDDRGKSEQKHVQPRTKGNKQQSLQTQLKGREALFYDGLQSVSLPGRPKQSIKQPKVGKAQMKTDMETASDSQTAEVQEDYTDYYPIPQKNTKEWMVKRPPRSGAAQPKNDHLGARSGVTNMQFTQHQTFSGEKKQRNISHNSRWSQPRTPRLSHQDRTGAPAPPRTAKKTKEDMPSNGGSNLIIE